MEILYKSTRGGAPITSCEAIIKGIADDGGLYVPDRLPTLDVPLTELARLSYKELALYILKKLLTDFEEAELRYCIEGAYDEKFETEDAVQLKVIEGTTLLELYHGPTLAFKDMALSILPYLLKTALKKFGVKKEVVILTATSGDTGKAALEGFSGVEGTRIVVFYPESGVSEIQKRQMVTQRGDNTHVVGIKGNFDDAQNGVKAMFNDSSYKALLEQNGYLLSSANSINIGRLVPQIVYYIYAYLRLLDGGKLEEVECINVAVPTGNFGNILAAYYAKEMGLPIVKLICASNENNVLYDFLNTGIYDIKRDFKLTISPSMDILISSNLERLLYSISGETAEEVSTLIGELGREGRYEISSAMKEGLKDFYGDFATDEETLNAIQNVYEEHGYVMDTHTSVAYSVLTKYRTKTGDKRETVLASTASPFKFTRSVCYSLGIEVEGKDDFQLTLELSKKTGLKLPKSVGELSTMPILHKKVCEISEMKSAVDAFLKL